MHQYFKKKLEINVTEDDTASKISFSLETNILSQKYTFKGDSLYFTENIDDIVQVVEDIVESVIYIYIIYYIIYIIYIDCYPL